MPDLALCIQRRHRLRPLHLAPRSAHQLHRRQLARRASARWPTLLCSSCVAAGFAAAHGYRQLALTSAYFCHTFWPLYTGQPESTMARTLPSLIPYASITYGSHSSGLDPAGICSTAMLRECVHAAEVRVPNFVVPDPTDRTPALVQTEPPLQENVLSALGRLRSGPLLPPTPSKFSRGPLL
jgi:hypothetical protein